MNIALPPMGWNSWNTFGSNISDSLILETARAMKEKGYDPVNQIVGYLLSGDPTYITSYKNARYLILRVERDELLEELVRSYARKQKRDEE